MLRLPWHSAGDRGKGKTSDSRKTAFESPPSHRGCTIPESGLSCKKAVTLRFGAPAPPSAPVPASFTGRAPLRHPESPPLSAPRAPAPAGAPQPPPEHWKCSSSSWRAGTWSHLSQNFQHPARGYPCLPLLLSTSRGHSPPPTWTDRVLRGRATSCRGCQCPSCSKETQAAGGEA